MSHQDEVRPYRARDVGSGQETADTLAEVLKHAAQRDEAARQKRPPRPQPRWMLPLGINLGVFAVYLLLAPPSWVVMSPIEPPAAEAQLHGVRTALYLAAGRIESYRLENGRLPERLEEVGVVTDGVEYVMRGAGRYQLVGFVDDRTIVYDSTQSLNEFGADLGLAARAAQGG